MEALRQSAIREGRVPAKITNVILASPDLDIDVFVRQFQMLGPERPKFTIFVSDDDRALRLSRLIAGNVGRLGSISPTQEPYLSLLENSGITVIDMSKLRTGDRLNHSKFAESPDVVKLIGQRLIEGQPLTDSKAGIGDHVSAVAIGATKFVGSAAGIIISTPIAVVDPDTRDNLSSQIESMTGAPAGAATPQSSAPPR
jgi:esterase/lipase superfamily enzyme